jgi:hypothetical protein
LHVTGNEPFVQGSRRRLDCDAEGTEVSACARRNQRFFAKLSERFMSPSEFKIWRKSLGLKQKEAAEKLGLKKRMIQYYETGKRGSKKVVIPKTVELACFALSEGVEQFDGNDRR